MNGAELGCGELSGWSKDTGEVRKLISSMVMLQSTSCRCNMSGNGLFDPPDQGTRLSEWTQQTHGCKKKMYSVALDCGELFGLLKHTGEDRKLIRSTMMLLCTSCRSNVTLDEQKMSICPTGSRYEVVRIMDGAVARVQKTFEWCCIGLWCVVWLAESHRRGQEIDSIGGDVVAVHAGAW